MTQLLYRLPITRPMAGVVLTALLIGAVARGVAVRHPNARTGRRHWPRWAAVTLLLLTTEAAWGVNTYFDYLPTLGSLLGRRAADQASAATIETASRGTTHARRHHIALPSHGAVVQLRIPGTRSHFVGRPAEIYLPPAWFARPRPDLPVLEMLAGTPGTPVDWTRAGFADLALDRLAHRHGGVAPIVVMPDANGGFTADTECVDGRQGAAETYLAVDVPEWVARHVEPRSRSGRWGVGGLSSGGFCAAELALRHPDQFALFLDYGGLDLPTHTGGPQAMFPGPRWQAIRDVDSYRISRLLAGRNAAHIAGWFEVGSADGETTRAVVRDALDARGRLASSDLVLVHDGHHTFRVWRRAFIDSVSWADRYLTHLGTAPSYDRLGLTPPHRRHQPA